jgi:hypothetical protein
MIPQTEVEILAKKIFGRNVSSVWQINKVTIRIELTNDSFTDIFQSIKDPTKFAFHARLTKGKIYRLDCRPERKYIKLKTFPWHFHKENEDKVVSSPFSSDKSKALVQFLEFINSRNNS